MAWNFVDIQNILKNSINIRGDHALNNVYLKVNGENEL